MNFYPLCWKKSEGFWNNHIFTPRYLQFTRIHLFWMPRLCLTNILPGTQDINAAHAVLEGCRGTRKIEVDYIFFVATK